MLAFFAPLIQPLLNFFGGPVIQGLVESYKNKLAAGNNSERIAADLAGRELAVEQRERELQNDYKKSLIGHWYEPVNLFGYCMVFYFGKSAVWDAALHLGTTDGLRGDTLTWAGMIMVFFVGTRGVVTVAKILRG